MIIIYQQLFNSLRRKLLICALFLGTLSGCGSYEQFKSVAEEFEIPNKIYKADYNQSWLAVLQIMKRYELELQNQESGVIKTRWIDNTLALNFADSFGGKESIKGARFKLVINVVKGFRSGREVSKVTVFKRQMVEEDFLQGWKVIRSDGIMEKALLYRIERLLWIDSQLKKIEEQKSREQEANF